MPRDESGTRDPMVGRQFANRFSIEKRIGTGGMGNIYKALQVDMNRPVALKVLHPHLGGDKEVVARFDREMRAATRIEHPNTIRVYEFGASPDGQLFIAMELLDGKPLSEAIETDSPFTPDRAAYIGQQIAHALAAAHSEKIVHRDLKPENVMLVDRYGQKDHVKVLDFGLARFTEDSDDDGQKAALTQAGVRVGTPGYMAPEYVAAFKFDARSDLYAVGVILYEMCTGGMPFTGRPYEVLEKQIHEDPEPPSKRNSDVPDWLDAIVMRLLARDPKQRPWEAMEVAHTLERGRARILSNPTTEEDVEALQRAVAAAARALPQRPAAPPEPAPAPAPASAPATASTLLAKARGNTARGAAPREIVAPIAERRQEFASERTTSRRGLGLAAAGCVGLAAVLGAVGLVFAAIVVLWLLS